MNHSILPVTLAHGRLDAAIHLRNQRDDLNRRTRTGGPMRSEAIFRAKEMIENKFSLCLTVSKATRRLHISPRSTQETISSAFARIASGSDLPILMDLPIPIESV
jgi:hypothetical protein